MANIGTFKKSGNEFQGEIVTLSVQAKGVRIVPETNRSNDNAPSHRVFVGRAEIGAAWSKRSNEGRDYLSLKLDDPSFTAPDLRQPLRRMARASPSSGRAAASRTATEPDRSKPRPDPPGGAFATHCECCPIAAPAVTCHVGKAFAKRDGRFCPPLPCPGEKSTWPFIAPTSLCAQVMSQQRHWRTTMLDGPSPEPTATELLNSSSKCLGVTHAPGLKPFPSRSLAKFRLTTLRMSTRGGWPPTHCDVYLP